MSFEINGSAAQGVQSLSGIGGIGETGNIQLMFAQLQMELAQTNKESALEKIEDIRQSQADSAAYTDVINSMRVLEDYDTAEYGALPTDPQALEQEIAACTAALEDLKSLYSSNQALCDGSATSPTLWTKESSNDYWFNNANIKVAGAYAPLRNGYELDHYGYEVKQGMEALSVRLEALTAMQTAVTSTTATGGSVLSDCGISINGSFTKDQASNWLANLQSSQEQIGTDIQQEMVFVQDFMGQYNSYTQGASSAISSASETLKAIARG